MLNHCFSLLNYFKLGISFFKEIRVVNSHIRYCLIFKFLFSHLSLSFELLSVTAWLLYHVVFCLSSTFSKFFEIFFRSETLLLKFSVNSPKLPDAHWRMIQFSRFFTDTRVLWFPQEMPVMPSDRQTKAGLLPVGQRDSFVIIPPSQAFVNTFFPIREVAYFSHRLNKII